MRISCPAKINLHLRIGPLRGDGFHPLLSWFCTAGLFDSLTLKPAADLRLPAGSHVALSCDAPDLPTDSRNLVVKVGDALGQLLGKESSVDAPPTSGDNSKAVVAVRADLRKRIPFGAGLGGGSSDAAFALIGLNRVWKGALSDGQLSKFAAKFGSDLSFFFHGPSSVCSGRGEIVRPISRPSPKAVLLILPNIAMPTGDVYRRFDAMKLGRTQDVEIEPDWAAWSTLGATDLLARLVNDLEPPAFAISPELGQLREAIESLLGRTVRMSGSGSSLFTLFDELQEAELAAERVATQMKIRVEAVQLAV